MSLDYQSSYLAFYCMAEGEWTKTTVTFLGEMGGGYSVSKMKSNFEFIGGNESVIDGVGKHTQPCTHVFTSFEDSFSEGN